MAEKRPGTGSNRRRAYPIRVRLHDLREPCGDPEGCECKPIPAIESQVKMKVLGKKGGRAKFGVILGLS